MLFEEEFTEDESFPVKAGLDEPRHSDFLIGHDDVEKSLIRHIEQNNLPHAMVFSGPQGIGKSTLAYRLARYLLANDGNSSQDSLFGEAAAPLQIESLHVDKENPVFSKVASGGHPDLLTIEKSVDSKTQKEKRDINVETARKVAPFLRMTSSEGGWRIVILDNADTMNKNAQNALLKILEEPPKKSLLILICHRTNAMIPTIRSRCRSFPLSALGESDFETLLEKEYGSEFSDQEKQLLRLLSNQQFGAVKKILDHDGLENVHACLEILKGDQGFDTVKIHQLAESVGRIGQEKAFEIIEKFFLTFISEIIFAKAKDIAISEALNNDYTAKALHQKSLHELLGAEEKIKNLFSQTIHSNLDKRICIINAFGALRL